MKRLLAPALSVVSCAAFAQAPDVAIQLQIRPTFSIEAGGGSRYTLYSRDGEYSLVGLSLRFERGLRMYVSQRFEQIPDNGADPETLDEFFLENRGLWRIGKQYLPFGQQSLYRETVPAARFDQDIDFLFATVTLAAFDAGEGRPRGGMIRIGRNAGVSIAAGEHLGISGTTLTPVRTPEEALGQGRGYDLIIGVDVDTTLGSWLVQAEWIAFREPSSPFDEPLDASDVTVSTSFPSLGHELAFGWSRNWTDSESFFRLTASLRQSRNVVWEPFLRFENLDFKDFGLTMRLRL